MSLLVTHSGPLEELLLLGLKRERERERERERAELFTKYCGVALSHYSIKCSDVDNQVQWQVPSLTWNLNISAIPDVTCGLLKQHQFPLSPSLTISLSLSLSSAQPAMTETERNLARVYRGRESVTGQLQSWGLFPSERPEFTD